ncbi:MAG: prephenate dehydratase [Chloroflexota bacterium]
MAEQQEPADLPQDVEAIRQQIDDADRQIVSLLNRRARLAGAIGEIKRQTGADIYQPAREAVVLERVVGHNAGPLGAEAVRAIYREIISACRAVERALRVGYLGPEGTFSHEAALLKFGASAELVACATIEEVFRETERGNVDYGLIPIENSTAGAVTPSLEAFLDARVQICAEVALPIVHNLMSHGQLAGIQRVYSHPQSFAQCRRWLAQNLPRAEQITVASNSQAVRLAEATDAAAVGPEAAGRLYGVPVLVRHIEDWSANVTRFLVLGPQRGARSGRDKSALVFSVKNRPGALRDALDIFASRNVDLTWIESRPSQRQPWDYVFFVDLLGHPDDAVVAEALAGLQETATFLKVLGAWAVEPVPAGQA